MRSEIKIARRLLSYRNLHPPIDIEALASIYADVFWREIPLDIDGLCLGLKKSGRRPRIIVNSSKIKTRQRFTLAHELGHVLIPWHTGTIVDEVDVSGSTQNGEYWEIEAEANRFASELLMPSDWVTEIFQQHSDPNLALKKLAKEGQISPPAAALKLISCMPAGFVFAQVTDNIVQLSGRSSSTLANQPERGSVADFSSTLDWTSTKWAHQIGNSIYHWWFFGADSQFPISESTRDWRSIQKDILIYLDLDAAGSKKFQASINGTCAYANGSVRRDRDAKTVYNALKQRFHSKSQESSEMIRFVSHPLFEEFLAARTAAFME